MSGIGRGPADSSVTSLRLPAALQRQIGAEAVRAAPAECCGLLIGRIEGAQAVVNTCIASPNKAADPGAGFEIDPALLLETQRHLRATGEQVLGHYHSHPHGNPDPSAADRARAWVPGHIWLIAAPAEKTAEPSLSAHLATEQKGRIFLRPLNIHVS